MIPQKDTETGDGRNPHPNPRPGGYPEEGEKNGRVLYKVLAAVAVVVLIAALFS